MKFINRDTDYAVKAFLQIAKRSPEVTSVSELVKRLEIPRPLLRKIFQILSKRGVLDSFKSKGGGFLLALPPEEIFLVDLIRTFQEPVKLNDCVFRKNICPDIKSCPLKKRIDVLESKMIEESETITLASLLEDGGYIP